MIMSVAVALGSCMQIGKVKGKQIVTIRRNFNVNVYFGCVQFLFTFLEHKILPDNDLCVICM
jgi:hypothetical protein